MLRRNTSAACSRAAAGASAAPLAPPNASDCRQLRSRPAWPSWELRGPSHARSRALGPDAGFQLRDSGGPPASNKAGGLLFSSHVSESAEKSPTASNARFGTPGTANARCRIRLGGEVEREHQCDVQHHLFWRLVS